MGSFSVLPPEARRLEGKVALIAGSASGIGASIARLFSKHGAKVVIADMQDELGQSICKELNPQSTTFVYCDLDIMNNNAGIAGEAKFNILENTQADFEQVVKVNLVGVFLGIKHAARVMIPNRKGSIITTASAASIVVGGAPHAYASSKHAVHGLTKNTAVELGHFGIRVNCVSPYIVATPLAMKFFKMDDDEASHVYSNLKGEVLKPKDVAEAALFLASDDSKYVSGHNLLIDGGFSIHNAGFCMFPQ
ncbi:hypothetical protein ACB098_05G114200 [Castanea mollissima]